MSSKRGLSTDTDNSSPENNNRIVQVSKKPSISTRLEESGSPCSEELESGGWIRSVWTENRYVAESKGPFFVYLYDSEKNKFIGNYHPVMIGKRLSEANIKVGKVLRAGADRVSIIFNTGEEANQFVNLVGILGVPSWFAVIPDQAVFKIGLIHDIPLELGAEDFMAGLDVVSRTVIRKIERCKQRSVSSEEEGEINWEDSLDVKIFCQEIIPKSLELYNFPYRVFNFIAPTRRCFDCQRFGHFGNACRYEPRCVRCGINHEGDCTLEARCANCWESHEASSMECIFLQFHKELNEIKSKLGRNNFQATIITRDLFKSKFGDEVSQALNLLWVSLNEEIEVSVGGASGKESSNLLGPCLIGEEFSSVGEPFTDPVIVPMKDLTSDLGVEGQN